MQTVGYITGYFCRVGEETNDISETEFGNEPDYDAFSPYSSLSVDVATETFGSGDIDKELKERGLLCMDNNAIQA
jgi:hypothetical protein